MNPLIRISGSLLLTAGTILSGTVAPHLTVKKVSLNIDGTNQSYQTKAATVGAFLNEQGISVKAGDVLSIPADAALKSGQNLTLTTATPVVVKVDGKEIRVNTLYKDVRSLLAALNIHIGELDSVSEPLSAMVTPGMEVTVKRVTVKESQELTPLNYSVRKVETKDLLKGKKKVKNQGSTGIASTVTRQFFVDGELAAQTEQEAVIMEPVDKTILIGTRKPEPVKVKAEETKTTVKSTSTSDSSRNWKTFRMTFYTNLPSENGGYSITASGKSLQYGMAASNYYSLGTKIYLDGWGTFTIEDRGGSDFNSSTRLDIFIPRKSGESNTSYLNRVCNMGVKSVSGYVK